MKHAFRTGVFMLLAVMAFCQTQHSVVLSWGASPTAGVTAYNVYRGSVAGGPYGVQVCTVAAPALTCNDSTVAAGATYYYIATAVSPGGESAPSNEAKAVIPIPPSPPQSLVIAIK